jgi:hypothetical protein
MATEIPQTNIAIVAAAVFSSTTPMFASSLLESYSPDLDARGHLRRIGFLLDDFR